MEMTEAMMEGLERLPETPEPRHPTAQNALTTAIPDAQARRPRLERRAIGLGWFSVGLGLAELLASDRVAQALGVDGNDRLRLALRAAGIRELTCGLGLLSRSRPAPWAWARLAGDVLNLTLLGYGWSARPPERARALAVGGGALGLAWVDAQTAIALSRSHISPALRGIVVKQGVTIQRAPDEVYTFFRDVQSLPRVMSHLESVREDNGHRSRWRARGPLGTSIEWSAEIVEDSPGEGIAWRSLPGADVSNRGRVTFRPAPGGLGTELRVELSYAPPLGAVGASVAKLFGREPSREIAADLRRMKQVLETGEVLHSDTSLHRRMHPARPARALPTPIKQEQS